MKRNVDKPFSMHDVRLTSLDLFELKLLIRQQVKDLDAHKDNDACRERSDFLQRLNQKLVYVDTPRNVGTGNDSEREVNLV
jgi:hypothetical protein